MVDDFTPDQPPAAPPPGGPIVDGGSSRGFLSTTTGKIVAIGGAVVVLLGIVAVVALFVLPLLFGGGDEEVAPSTPPAGQAEGAAASAEATGGVASEPGPLASAELFTFRDIFDPLIKPEPVEAESPTSPEAPDVSSGTLFLQDIVSIDGQTFAVLLWDGTEYVLGEGESIPGTPWQVLSISDDSVVMLYGDVQVTLTIGQGVTK